MSFVNTPRTSAFFPLSYTTLFRSEDVELRAEPRLLIERAREEAVDDVERPVHAEPDIVPRLVARRSRIREHDHAGDRAHQRRDIRPREPAFHARVVAQFAVVVAPALMRTTTGCGPFASANCIGC